MYKSQARQSQSNLTRDINVFLSTLMCLGFQINSHLNLYATSTLSLRLISPISLPREVKTHQSS